MTLDKNITVEEMIKSYFHRIGKPELIGNNDFIFRYNTFNLRSDEYKNKTIGELHNPSMDIDVIQRDLVI